MERGVSKGPFVAVFLFLFGAYLLFSHLAFVLTGSVELSVCIVRSPGNLERGDVAFFRDGQIKKSGAIVKYVGCLPGEEVRISAEGAYCNEKIMTSGRSEKKIGEIVSEEYRLGPNEYFLYGTHRNSFDSRYVGPINGESIFRKGVACF